MTNVDEIFNSIVAQGQHPRSYADTFVLLEQVGHALDMENQKLYDRYKKEGLDDIAITKSIEENLNIADILEKAGSNLGWGIRDLWNDGQWRYVFFPRPAWHTTGVLLCR